MGPCQRNYWPLIFYSSLAIFRFKRHTFQYSSVVTTAKNVAKTPLIFASKWNPKSTKLTHTTRKNKTSLTPLRTAASDCRIRVLVFIARILFAITSASVLCCRSSGGTVDSEDTSAEAPFNCSSNCRRVVHKRVETSRYRHIVESSVNLSKALWN